MTQPRTIITLEGSQPDFGVATGVLFGVLLLLGTSAARSPDILTFVTTVLTLLGTAAAARRWGGDGIAELANPLISVSEAVRNEFRTGMLCAMGPSFGLLAIAIIPAILSNRWELAICATNAFGATLLATSLAHMILGMSPGWNFTRSVLMLAATIVVLVPAWISLTAGLIPMAIAPLAFYIARARMPKLSGASRTGAPLYTPISNSVSRSLLLDVTVRSGRWWGLVAFAFGLGFIVRTEGTIALTSLLVFLVPPMVASGLGRSVAPIASLSTRSRHTLFAALGIPILVAPALGLLCAPAPGESTAQYLWFFVAFGAYAPFAALSMRRPPSTATKSPLLPAVVGMVGVATWVAAATRFGPIGDLFAHTSSLLVLSADALLAVCVVTVVLAWIACDKLFALPGTNAEDPATEAA